MRSRRYLQAPPNIPPEQTHAQNTHTRTRSHCHVQAPPNLTPEADDSQPGRRSSDSQLSLAWRALLAAGVSARTNNGVFPTFFINVDHSANLSHAVVCQAFAASGCDGT